MASVFISYNRESKEKTATLVNDIEALGHAVWLDQGLSGGQAWWDQILARVRGCDLFVFVLDPVALDSTACKRECDYAADLGKPVLPILVSDGVSLNLLPPALSKIQFVDYRMPDRRAALLLARALATVPLSKPLPDPLPPVPEAPISYLGGLKEQVETTSTLSYQQQSALVVDLKRSLRDREVADDTRALLTRLRKRHDLFATIAEEIDELLGSRSREPSVPPRTAVPEPPSEVEAPSVLPRTAVPETRSRAEASQDRGAPSPPTAPRMITLRQRSLGAAVGASAGLLLGVLMSSVESRLKFGALLVTTILAAAAGIAGAIAPSVSRSVTLRQRALGAVVGAAVASMLGALVVFSLGGSGAFEALLFGAAGAIAGAISGVRGRVIAAAAAGLVLGFGVSWIVLGLSGYPGRYLSYLSYGYMRIGAVLGAIVGATWEEMKVRR